MFAKVKDNVAFQFPYGPAELNADNPATPYPEESRVDVSFPTTAAFASGYRIVTVVEAPVPTFDAETQRAQLASMPVLTNDVWTVPWEVTNKTVDELAHQLENKKLEVRFRRNELLQLCDWTQAEDSPMDKQAWKTYRQALRDVTTQATFPNNIVWPEAPGNVRIGVVYA
jgi:hypothetical protein